MTPERVSLRPIVLAALAAASILIVLTVVRPYYYFVFPGSVYLPIHALIEIASIVVSFTIFAIYWSAYRENGNSQGLFIGTAFLAVAIMDAMHTLSFPGMPDFITPSSVDKGIQYWIPARLWAAAALLVAAFIPSESRNLFLRRGVLLVLNLAVAALPFVMVSFFFSYLQPMFIDGQGLTPLKIGLEYLVAVLSTIAGLIFLRRYLRTGDEFQKFLTMGLVITVFAELCFTLYASAYDMFNVAGHVYKVIAYYFIFNALFVSAVRQPYLQLGKLYDQIENQLKRTIVDLKETADLANERAEQLEEVGAERERLLAEVQRRAAELDMTNKELESFSYSVSHDLRAPLRHIDGFSELLLSQYSDRLDQDGKEYLQFVREGAERMRQLIDDLLKLSRVTRAEIHPEPVDLSGIARAVTQELCQEQPERHVDISIPPDVMADGDPQLLRVVMDNLLRNAWKFTSKRDQAKIEFSFTEANGERAYYVKDNGAGFDMAYKDKLFGAFQRLHSIEEFSGTGIGLATVQRIINRHHGRVWAEGAVDEGATFYFTLNRD